MASQHNPYKDIRAHYIYVLISQFHPGENPKVFIGRTTRHDLKGVLRTQRSNGRRKKGLVASLFQPDSQVSIHLLEQVETTNVDTHRHLLAWTRYFVDSGYHVITGSGIYQQASSMHANTKEIYQAISKHSIPEILALHLVPEKRTDAEPLTNSAPELNPRIANPESIPLNSRISIRVTEQELRSFKSFCRRCGMTQREGFLILMEASGEESCTQELISELSNENQALKDRIRSLEERLKNPEAERLNREYRRRLRVQRKVLNSYFTALSRNWAEPAPNSYTPNPIHALPPTSLFTYYKYPTENRLFRFRMECTLRGKGRYGALFLFGHDLNRNEPVKLRYYPRSSFFGVSPSFGSFYTEGSCLLVGCRIQGEVAELCAAFPLLHQGLACPEDAGYLYKLSPVNDLFDFEFSEEAELNPTERDEGIPFFEIASLEEPDYLEPDREMEFFEFSQKEKWGNRCRDTREGKDEHEYEYEYEYEYEHEGKDNSPQGIVQDILDDATSRSG